MPKLVRALLIGIMMLIPLAATGVAAPLRQGDDHLYLALGDSLTVGVGAQQPGEGGYAALTFERLRGNGLITQLRNLAVSGETSASLIGSGQLERAAATIRDPEVNTSVVSLHIGGNDLLWLLFSGPCPLDPVGPECRALIADSLTGFASNYPIILQTLTDAIEARGNGSTLYVNTYYNVFSGTGTIYERPVEAALLGSDGVVDCDAAATDPAAMGLNDIIACVAPTYGAQVVDHHPQFRGQGLALTLIARTDPHPNDAGHRILANTLSDAILGAP